MHHAPDPAELSTDPDNMPPRSRLFLVVPKLADTQQIQVGGMPIGLVWGSATGRASVVGHTSQLLPSTLGPAQQSHMGQASRHGIKGGCQMTSGCVHA